LGSIRDVNIVTKCDPSLSLSQFRVHLKTILFGRANQTSL